MARANVARRRGDDFQARLFWLKAAALLDDRSAIERVSYESGPRAFEDIVVEYDPSRAPRDHEGEAIEREFVQCKWHARAGTFGYRDLVDPGFINATRVSLLQRAREAQCELAPGGRGLVFKLLTNWRIEGGDPLLQLIGKGNDAIDVNRLFTGKTERSTMGRVRRLWREHLGISDDELRNLARVLAVAESSESLATLRERLDERFAAVGMRRVPAAESAFFYDDLIVKLFGQGSSEFDREGFRCMARREGLLRTPRAGSEPTVVGVRSFMHSIDHLTDRCAEMLDLVRYFDGRYIRRNADWQERVEPALREFLVDAAKREERIRLVLDTHVSLAFAAGTVLNVKSGREVEIEQRTAGRRFWSRDDMASDPAWPELKVDEEIVADRRDAVAVAVGLTHDVSAAVSGFVRDALPDVGRILHCRATGGASQQSVQGGRHAWQLAEQTVARLLSIRAHGGSASPVHLFIAGPNGFAFFLGQQPALGPARVYEWDLEGQRGGGYSLGIALE